MTWISRPAFYYFNKVSDFLDAGVAAKSEITNNAFDASSIRVTDFSYVRPAIKEVKLVKMESRYLQMFDTALDRIFADGDVKRQRIKISSDARGVFDFGLVSKGLYIPTEYFSQELAADLPNEFPPNPSGIVPPEYVLEQKSGEDVVFYYVSPQNQKTYYLVAQKKGQRAIDLGTDSQYDFATTVTKAYIMPVKKGGKPKKVQIYIPINQGISYKDMIPSGLVAKYCQIQGIKTKISFIRVCESDGKQWMAAATFKDYDDELDLNVLNYYLQDNWWHVIRGTLSAIYANELVSKNKNWSGSTSITGSYPSGTNFLDAWKRWCNFYKDLEKRGKIEPDNVDKKLLFIIEPNSGTGYELDYMISVFYRIANVVDFQFNKTEDALRKMYDRMVTKELEKLPITNQTPQEKEELTLKFKKAATDAFSYSFFTVKNGVYSDTNEEIDKNNEEFNTKIEKLNQFLSAL